MTRPSLAARHEETGLTRRIETIVKTARTPRKNQPVRRSRFGTGGLRLDCIDDLATKNCVNLELQFGEKCRSTRAVSAYFALTTCGLPHHTQTAHFRLLRYIS